MNLIFLPIHHIGEIIYYISTVFLSNLNLNSYLILLIYLFHQLSHYFFDLIADIGDIKCHTLIYIQSLEDLFDQYYLES